MRATSMAELRMASDALIAAGQLKAQVGEEIKAFREVMEAAAAKERAALAKAEGAEKALATSHAYQADLLTRLAKLEEAAGNVESVQARNAELAAQVAALSADKESKAAADAAALQGLTGELMRTTAQLHEERQRVSHLEAEVAAYKAPAGATAASSASPSSVSAATGAGAVAAVPSTAAAPISKSSSPLATTLVTGASTPSPASTTPGLDAAASLSNQSSPSSSSTTSNTTNTATTTTTTVVHHTRGRAGQGGQASSGVCGGNVAVEEGGHAVATDTRPSASCVIS